MTSAGTSIQRDGAARRAAILGGAVQVFAQLGYDGASLRELAAGAGMQKGHLTYYFPTKDDLLFEIVDDLHEKFLQGIDTWSQVPARNPKQRLLSVFAAHVELVCQAHEQTRVAYESFRFLTPDRRATVRTKRDQYEQRVAMLIDEGRATKGLVAEVPTSLLVKAVLGLLNWPYQWYSPAGEISSQELSRIFSQRAVSALRPIR